MRGNERPPERPPTANPPGQPKVGPQVLAASPRCPLQARGNACRGRLGVPAVASGTDEQGATGPTKIIGTPSKCAGEASAGTRRPAFTDLGPLTRIARGPSQRELRRPRPK